MTRHFYIAALVGALVLAACGRNPQTAPDATFTQEQNMDPTAICGLVCDGSNDTIVVFLRDPFDGSDPDTLNILDASRMHQVFGNLRIGDRVVMKRNAADSTKADIVVVTQDLLGSWCYKVKPTLRQRAGMEAADMQVAQLPDSVRQLLEEEREYGFTLKIDSVAMPIGTRLSAATADESSPVEYPQARRYGRWCISDGRLLLQQTRMDSLGNTTVTAADTAELVALTPDTLVLRFADGEHGYYRRLEP